MTATERRDAPPDRLPDEPSVLLDPAVELLEPEVSGHRLLANGHLDTGMVIPPGDGLVDFVRTLAAGPVTIGELRAQYDDQQIIDTMLASLIRHGYLHLAPPQPPTPDELTRLRQAAARTRAPGLRRPVVVDLDGGAGVAQVRQRVDGEVCAPELTLVCARLADHEDALTELADLRRSGAIRLHHTVVRTGELCGAPAVCRALVRLCAEVHLDDVPWPGPAGPVPGLDEMTGRCVAVHALMTPDASILDEPVRRAAVAWARSAVVSGLCLRLDPDVLPSSGGADAVAVFEAVRAIEDELGDVQIVTLPSDEVLLGNTVSTTPPVADAFRTAYLRWRIPLLKSVENDNSWSQVPEVEDKLVRSDQDLLPCHPELAGLRPGAVVVDVCGGLGRVARRLSPVVGDDGLVVSIEMFRCLSDRARRFACERGVTNVHFRPGLAQRIPLPDATADAAVNEWTGGIWELGMGPAMVAEMARVVRPGGRVALTHRLVQLDLGALAEPWVQYGPIHRWMREAVDHPALSVVTERVWGQIVPSLVGENATNWRKQYMPRLINPFEVTYRHDPAPGTRADVFLTIVAERR